MVVVQVKLSGNLNHPMTLVSSLFVTAHLNLIDSN